MVNIREYRQRAGLSQRELADKTGLTLMTIWRYEANERVPSVINAIKIAKALNCTVDELVKEQ